MPTPLSIGSLVLKTYIQQFDCLYESEHCAKKDMFYIFFIENVKDHCPVKAKKAFALLVRDLCAGKYIKTTELHRLVRNNVISKVK